MVFLNIYVYMYIFYFKVIFNNISNIYIIMIIYILLMKKNNKEIFFIEFA